MKGVKPRQALIPLGLGTALSLIGDGTLYTVLPSPEIAGQIGLSAASVGLVLGANRLVRLLFNPIAGSLNDRFSRRWLLVGSMLIGTISTGLYALSSGLGGVLVGRVLWGAAWAGIWVGAHAMILDVAAPGDRGRLNGIYQLWFFSGVALTALAGGALTDWLGLRTTLWIGTALTGLTCLYWLAALPETRPALPQRDDGVGDAPVSSYPWRAALPAALPYFAVRLTTAGILASTTILWLSLYFEGGLTAAGVPLKLATLTGLFVAVRTLTSVGGAPLAGWLSDRLGRRWGLIALVLFLGSLGLAGMTAAQFTLAAVGALTVALAGPGVQSLVPALIGDRIESTRRSKALGIVFSVGDLGSAIGPPLAFALLPLIELRGVYWAAAGFMLLSAAAALLPALREPKRVPSADSELELGLPQEPPSSFKNV